MLRAQFVRNLKKHEIEVPDTQVRRRKGTTSYFFHKTQRTIVEQLLRDAGLSDHGLVRCAYTKRGFGRTVLAIGGFCCTIYHTSSGSLLLW